MNSNGDLVTSPEDLWPMDEFKSTAPLKIDLVYATASHPENLFEVALYRADARLWLHRELAEVVIKAARICYQKSGYIVVLKDGLRPVDVQAAMYDAPIVKANPHWTAGETRMLAEPGQGGHPRGMAIDMALETADGCLVDMGTHFDHLPNDPADNPASRNYEKISNVAKSNRRLLTQAMLDAASALNRQLLPLPSEWWDFRFPAAYSERYAALCEHHLLPHQRMSVKRVEHEKSR
ncbi:M15 family metallopeptidase [Paraburkholderia solisilvae]|uniref:D-alanyl-D-alanine dipeptidase n=1 Tax=Paraburkholderia solisilvae TaxID=624376 RepID=A0A6J5EDM8_9BURK|nr:M15 family metallopeptidase [Paraburkholderia solisilvae]CAB3764383.1 D-alanyl-D-alanine dipeptidase [Paraburkholderia solisilvae]